MIKKKLAKKMRQNRPIPYWIRMRTDNTIRFITSQSPFRYSVFYYDFLLIVMFLCFRYNAKRRHWRRTKLGFWGSCCDAFQFISFFFFLLFVLLIWHNGYCWIVMPNFGSIVSETVRRYFSQLSNLIIFYVLLLLVSILIDLICWVYTQHIGFKNISFNISNSNGIVIGFFFSSIFYIEVIFVINRLCIWLLTLWLNI